MRVLGELRGNGRLVVNGADAFDVEYELTVREHAGIKSGDGWLFSDVTRLHSVFQEPDPYLRLDDDRTVKIVLTRTSGNNVNFKTSGPVPGF